MTSTLLTLPEVAERLRVSRRSVEQLIAAGELRALHPTPGRTAVTAREVDAYLAQQEATGRSRASNRPVASRPSGHLRSAPHAASVPPATRTEGTMATRRRRKAGNGEGTVYWSRADRQWIAALSVGTLGGKRRRYRARAASEEDAKAQLERLRRLHAAGGDPATGTLGQWLEVWLRSHGPSVRPSTHTSYEGHIRLHIVPAIGGVRLARLQPRDVRRLVDSSSRRASRRPPSSWSCGRSRSR